MMYMCTSQKRMLIQLPEQKELSENEIRTHQLVQHRNIIDLVESQIRPSGGHGNSIAYLLFPYYRVTMSEMEHAHSYICTLLSFTEWDLAGFDGARAETWPFPA